MNADGLAAWLADQAELDVERVDQTHWFTVLAGDHKRTIPTSLRLTDRDLVVESFFMAAPDENREQVYAYLLRRNLRTYTFRFALADNGDVLLVAVLPRAALSGEELDRTLGALLLTADESYDSALRTGFAGYIDREQAWRAKVGAPRNPIT